MSTPTSSTRRQFSKGAAWAVPVVAAAAAAPASTASPTGCVERCEGACPDYCMDNGGTFGNVTITGACEGIPLLGNVGVFHITSHCYPLLAGTTLAVSLDGLALGLALHSTDDWAFTWDQPVGWIGNGYGFFVLKRDLQCGETSRLPIQGIRAELLRTYRIQLALPLGNPNMLTDDDSALLRLSGVQVGPILVGVCETLSAKVAEIQTRVDALTPQEQQRILDTIG